VKAQQAQELEQSRGKVFDALAKPEFGAHEDARQIVDSPEYAQAIGKAPDVIRECAQSWDPSLQKLALEWYKAKAGIKSPTGPVATSGRADGGSPRSTERNARASPEAKGMTGNPLKRAPSWTQL
jgi:hypothetical protein